MTDAKAPEINVGGKVTSPAEAKADQKEEAKPALPKLSPAEFKAYNKMAEGMEYYHNHFRQSWTLLYNACVSNSRPRSMTLKQFLQTGIQLCSHLNAHHSIEEAHIFPLLATRMPEFRNHAELLRQHQQIHAGMDGFEAYLREVQKGDRELVLAEMKEKMDTWGTVLWTHLDDEVKVLGAENMRKWWTVQEIARMPM